MILRATSPIDAEGLSGVPPPIRLLDSAWLERHVNSDFRLTNRQHIEKAHPQALLSPEAVRAMVRSSASSDALPIVVVSHPWTAQHASDPDGLQLSAIVGCLRRLRRTHPDTFPKRVGVLYDQASMLQKTRADGAAEDDEGTRTPLELASFRAALDVLLLWYGHPRTLSLVLADAAFTSEDDASSTGIGLAQRGWPFVERAVSWLVKSPAAKWPLYEVVDQHGERVARDGAFAKLWHSHVPLPPSEFARRLHDGFRFRNGKTTHREATHAYGKVVRTVVPAAQALDLRARAIDDAGTELVVGMLAYAPKVRLIDMRCNDELTDASAARLADALSAGAARYLRRLCLPRLAGGGAGVCRLAEVCDALGIALRFGS